MFSGGLKVRYWFGEVGTISFKSVNKLNQIELNQIESNRIKSNQIESNQIESLQMKTHALIGAFRLRVVFLTFSILFLFVCIQILL